VEWGTDSAEVGSVTFLLGHDYGMWGTDSVTSGFFAPHPSGIAPHIERNPAPLQMESVPHLHRNMHNCRPKARAAMRKLTQGAAATSVGCKGGQIFTTSTSPS
jgi:hypothetical protein